MIQPASQHKRPHRAVNRSYPSPLKVQPTPKVLVPVRLLSLHPIPCLIFPEIAKQGMKKKKREEKKRERTPLPIGRQPSETHKSRYSLRKEEKKFWDQRKKRGEIQVQTMKKQNGGFKKEKESNENEFRPTMSRNIQYRNSKNLRGRTRTRSQGCRDS